MDEIDGIAPDLRALVYEFGYQIVAAMITFGYSSAAAIRSDLETWRKRRQLDLLAQNFDIDRARMLALASRFRSPRNARRLDRIVVGKR
jgi:hypothetical protein